MRQHQILQHQHLLPLRDLTPRQGEHYRVIFLNAFTRLIYRGVQGFILLAVLFFPRADPLLCRAFIFDPLERRDIQGIDGAQCLCRTPLAIVMLFLHAYPGAFALGCRMFQRRAGACCSASRWV